MKRRNYLVTLGATGASGLLAGCLGNGSDEQAQSDGDADGGDTPQENGTGSSGGSLTIEESKLVPTPDMWYAEFVEFDVRNESGSPVEQFEFVIDWYDEDEYLSSVEGGRRFFAPGDSWAVRSEPGTAYEEATDFEVKITGTKTVDEFASNSISLDSVELLAGDEATVRVKTENETDEDDLFVYVGVNVLNADGVIIGSEWDLPDWGPKESKTVNVTVNTLGRVDEASDAQAFLLE